MIRLVGAVLMEQTDEWAEQRRYLGLELLAKARWQHTADHPDQPEVMTPEAITA